MNNTTILRASVFAAAALLGLGLLVRLAAPSARPNGRARAATTTAAPRVTSSRIPLVSRLLQSLTRAAAAPVAPRRAGRAPQKPTTGGWTLDECLADQRRPDVASEMAELTAETSAMPAELARTLALEATDRAYHDALARAEGIAATSPEQAYSALEEALTLLPEAHHIARLRILSAMQPLARSCRSLAERTTLANRELSERAALVDLAASAGLLSGADEAAARREMAQGSGTQDALEPLLAGLLSGSASVGEAD